MSKDWTLKQIDYSFEPGFQSVWLLFRDGNSALYKLEACLSDNYAEPTLDTDDDGMRWGICGDINAHAAEEFGWDECIAYMHEMVRENCPRIEVV